MGTGLAASAAHPRRNQIWVPPPPPGYFVFHISIDIKEKNESASRPDD